jgi:hypothetical protein
VTLSPGARLGPYEILSSLGSGAPEKVFEFPDPDLRIDYPVWSPDGRWVLFDRFRPQGGDI